MMAKAPFSFTLIDGKAIICGLPIKKAENNSLNLKRDLFDAAQQA
jgi:hypothetical protein